MMADFKGERDINVSTRFAEGFFNGLKFSIVHALVYAPYYSKVESMINKTSFAKEFLKH
jgi:hypothetical protein